MYDNVWILAEQRAQGAWHPSAFELIAAARTLAPTVHAVTWGDADADFAVLGEYGVSAVHRIDIGDQLPAMPVSAAFAPACATGAELILAATSYDGRDILARLSARLDRTLLSNAIGLVMDGSQLVVRHAIFGGTTIVEACFDGPPPHLVLVRPKSFVPEPIGGSAPIVDLLDTVASDVSARIISSFAEPRSGPVLDEAQVVVAGGRGLGSVESFDLVEKLAALLHGAPAASRAVVDAGWVPYAYQVGQTGATVKPVVYIACGISGATQHIVGMKGAQHIVAINKDPDAPIFAIADLGVVGDVAQVLPRLISALQARESQLQT